MSAHTPGPWRWEETITDEVWEVRGSDNTLVAELPLNGHGTPELRAVTRADVAVIVGAVNAHAPLLKGLTEFLEDAADIVQVLRLVAPGLVLNSAEGAAEAASMLADADLKLTARIAKARELLEACAP